MAERQGNGPAGAQDLERIRAGILDVPDHPRPGVVFKDVTPLLADPVGFDAAIACLSAPFRDAGPGIDLVAAVEARGFLLGAPLALALGVGLVPVRKKGKLPRRTVSAEYSLEYGTAQIEIHEDAVRPGQRILLVDDVLATGGTAAAACGLLEDLGGIVAAVAVLAELSCLNGRKLLAGRRIEALTAL